MNPIELRGRTIVRVVAGTWFVLLILPMILNLFVSFDIVRIHGLPRGFFIRLVFSIFVGLAIALCLVCLYRGQAWARWLTIVFCALAVYRGISQGVPGYGRGLWVGFFALLLAAGTAGALLIAPSVRAYYRALAPK